MAYPSDCAIVASYAVARRHICSIAVAVSLCTAQIRAQTICFFRLYLLPSRACSPALAIQEPTLPNYTIGRVAGIGTFTANQIYKLRTIYTSIRTSECWEKGRNTEQILRTQFCMDGRFASELTSGIKIGVIFSPNRGESKRARSKLLKLTALAPSIRLGTLQRQH